MILLTGVTGNVGGATAKVLMEQGIDFRAIARSPEKVKPAISQKNEIIACDLSDAVSVRKALKGVSRMLLVTPNNEQQARLESAVVDLAAEEGVQQIVKISSIEAGRDAVAPVAKLHYEVEQHIEKKVPHYAFLRPTFYMQTLFMLAQPMKAAGIVPMPLGDTKISMIDVRDLGKAAANLLSREHYSDGVFPVTGTAPISLTDIAAKFADKLGKEIKYVDMPEAAYREQLNQVLKSQWHVDAICTLFEEIKAGALNHNFTLVDALSGAAATTLDQFIQDHAMIFGVA